MREKRMPQKIPWPVPGDRTTDANEHSPQVNSTGKANYSLCTKEQIPLNSSSRSGWDTHPSKRHLGIRGGSLRWTAGCPGYSIGSKSCKMTEWSYTIKINKCTTYNVNKSPPSHTLETLKRLTSLTFLVQWRSLIVGLNGGGRENSKVSQLKSVKIWNSVVSS